MLLCVLCALWTTVAHGAEEPVTLDGHIRHLSVTRDVIYVCTEQSLYQLTVDLRQVQRVSMRGVLVHGQETRFSRVSQGAPWNATLMVNVLLPFVSNNTLVLCGVLDDQCGYCEVLDLRDVSSTIYSEDALLGPASLHSASVALLATVTGMRGKKNEMYILTATEQSEEPKNSPCTLNEDILYFFNTNNAQSGDIFSKVDSSGTRFKRRPGADKVNVSFVDGVQVDTFIYLFSNVRSSSGNTVHLLWLEAKGGKGDTIKSLRGATLSPPVPDTLTTLLASSVVSGTSPLTWAGVFSVDGSRANTELLLFDVTPDLRGSSDTDKFFCSVCRNTVEKRNAPLKVLLKQSYMSSVLALKHHDWLLFFIGTADGQLIKLAVDKNYHPSCPRVLYRANDDREVFPKLHVDEVDHKHLYVAFTNQIMRIPVSACPTYTSLHECWSAQDPLCVWCDSTKSCTFRSECRNSSWISISEDLKQEKMVSFRTERDKVGQITLVVQTHVTAGPDKPNNFACEFPPLRGRTSKKYPQCMSTLSNSTIPTEGLEVTVRIRMFKTEWSQKITLMNCTKFRGPASPVLCRECIKTGCAWNSGRCSWANEGSTNESSCQMMESGMSYLKPEISSAHPSVVSFYGRNHALMTGHNLSHVTKVRIQAQLDCNPQESPVWNNTGVALTFHIPSAKNKGVVKVCAVLPDGSCHGNAQITYRSSPSCTGIKPNSSWLSGGRNVTLTGSHMNFIEAVIHSHDPFTTQSPVSINSQNITYISSAAVNPALAVVYLRVANETLNCSTTIAYHPNPVFTSYTSIRTGGDASITLQKKADKLDISPDELQVLGVGQGKEYICIMKTKETNNETDFYTCEIKNTPNAEFEHLMIRFGDTTVLLKPQLSYLMYILLVLLLIPFIIVVVGIVYRKKQYQLTTRMNHVMEKVEMDIRNDIRQGFIDLQIEKTDLMENVGTIPFLDYKHFASRIFFPENEALMKACVKDIGQDGVMVQLDECCQALSKLIRDQQFLISMVHALEEQKSFSIKDKCVVASMLTVALHSDLCYLTDVMEDLLKDLMRQNSNTLPKLLLRRTESTVEKLLTNWMSICLYGFLRESVGQQLYLLVNALSQQISKGPVDCVTEKALYTLSEDWLLWQAQDFTTLKLKVLFAVGSDGDLSEPLEVTVLSCDTVDQVKDKILTTFRTKFGFPYIIPIREICIEYVRGNASLRLEEVDLSSERLGDVTMLNTIKHYKIPDGATIKVLSRKTHAPLSPQGSVKDDQDFSGKYFHLIDPDVVEDLKNPERKKLKLKEVHLTKLLSTKVAVHSYVEKLFQSIWGLQYNKAPLAVKYFFDFLDAQAEDMKITDPDVLHIWKTNSLPLRFWVNILKNPQFVFDLEKSPHLDGCLSVIAQAFMDSFSLTDMQLGKHTPTNKLLYAKEIPKFKQEVKGYYKQIQEQPSMNESEFRVFLQKESKKHESEFNEAAALKELYKFIQKYFTEIEEKLNQNGTPPKTKEQFHHVKDLFDGLKSCSWN